MNNPILTLSNVHTHIGQYHILHGVDFPVAANRITMLLGRNGAGKTTTMRTIMGLWKASQGELKFKDQILNSLDTPQISNLGISYIPENIGIFMNLSVEENMRVAAKNGPIDEERLEWLFGFFPTLKKFWQWPAGKLSGGQKQMLAIARATIEPCDLLLVDEPSKGLAPSIIEALIGAFEELKNSNTTILMVEQNFNMAKRLGDQVAVMDDGVVSYRGTMKEFIDNEDKQNELLGLNLEAKG